MLLFLTLFYIGVEVINNVLASGVQQSDSVIHIHSFSNAQHILTQQRIVPYDFQMPCWIVKLDAKPDYNDQVQNLTLC